MAHFNNRFAYEKDASGGVYQGCTLLCDCGGYSAGEWFEKIVVGGGYMDLYEEGTEAPLAILSLEDERV
jgi:hypothetical protein